MLSQSGRASLRASAFVLALGVFSTVVTVRASASAVTEPSLKGYGIKAVPGADLAAMLDRCARAEHGPVALDADETPALLKARCDQLRRSLKTQPGNTARARS